MQSTYEPAEYRSLPNLTDEEYAEYTYKAGFALIASGDLDAGVDIGIQAATERPCSAVFEVLETLAHDANRPDIKGPYLRAMRWLRTNSNKFGHSARFLSNLAHAEEDSGNLADSIAIVEHLSTKYPHSPEHLLRLAGLYMNAGFSEKARTCLSRVSEGDFSEAFRERAQLALGLMPDQSSTDLPEVAITTDSNRVTFILLGGLMFMGVVIWCLVKVTAVWR